MWDITYCASADCPSVECRIKVANNEFAPGEIFSMADFSRDCRFYIGWLLSRMEESST